MKKILAIGIVALLVLGVGLVAASVNDNKEVMKIGPDMLGLKLAEDRQDTQTMEIYDELMDNFEVLPTPSQQEVEKVEIEIGADMLGLEIAEEGTVEKISPKSYHFSGSLNPGYYRLHGTFAWSGGDEVKITASWTPSNQNIRVGIFDRNAGSGRVVWFTGGSDRYTFTVPWGSNNWAIFVGNPSSNPQSIQYSGYLEEL